MTAALDDMHQRFLTGIQDASKVMAAGGERRIGAELKFPLVREDGSTASRETVQAFWDYLQEKGWRIETDSLSGMPIGARIAGEQNDTVVSYETGYSKIEFSFAHVGHLAALEEQVKALPDLCGPFAERHKVRFLCLGIHPVTPPGKALLAKKDRASFWDRVFPSNQVIPAGEGDDMQLFTVNAASHVHISVAEEEAIPFVNVLNGFAGVQIALGADSSVWRGAIDDTYVCVAEKLWDWWVPAQGRVGVPPAPYEDTRHYVESIARLKPVYVKRDGKPVVLKDYATFLDFYGAEDARGEDADGQPVPVIPQPEDIKTHNSCYWYNARVSRYYTVENRVFDQQPQDALLTPAALTLGLAAALPEADELRRSMDWAALRRSRDRACQDGLEGTVNGKGLRDLALEVLRIAQLGLERRGKGEAAYIEPLWRRAQHGACPARDAAAVAQKDGIPALVNHRALH